MWVDLDPELTDVADRWYENEHLPERVETAGYLGARRFRAVSGTPEFLSLFEAATPPALASDGYRRVTQTISPLSQRIRGGFRRCIRSTYVVHSSFGQASGGTLLCLRLGIPDPQQQRRFADWASADFADWARSRPAVLSGHALGPSREVRERMDSFRATGQSDEWVDAVLLLEFGRPEAAQSWLASTGRDDLLVQGVEAQQIDAGVYQFMVGFAAP